MNVSSHIDEHLSEFLQEAAHSWLASAEGTGVRKQVSRVSECSDMMASRHSSSKHRAQGSLATQDIQAWPSKAYHGQDVGC